MKQTNAECGVVFIAALILLAGMSVVIVALANEVSLDLKMAASLVEADQALEIAKVGIDKIVYAVNNDANWRTTYTSGTKYGPFSLGDGTFCVTIIDDDGDLADSPIDSVTVTSVAAYKGTTRTVSATLTPPVHESMMYLAYVWKKDKKLGFEAGPRAYGDLCSFNKIDVIGALPDFRGDIYYASPGGIDGSLDDEDTDIIMLSAEPAAPNVDLNWFIGRASTIGPPLVGDTYEITGKRISSDNNPHGFSNSNGIYYLDAGGKNVKFTRCYIEATIVIKRAGTVTFDEAGVHLPKETYYPALIVEGNVVYAFDKNLSESESGVDLNGDGDKTDIFTPSISGVVFATKTLTALQGTGGTNIVRFKGTLVAENIKLIGSGCIFEQDPSLAAELVSQFQGGGMKLVKGSLRIE